MKKLGKFLPKNLRKALSSYLLFITSPKEAFIDLNKKTLEDATQNYLLLLISSSILAGLVSVAVGFASAVYVNIFLHANVQYLRMLNYTLGRGISTTFFFLFAGTFLLFIASMALSIFTRGIKYSDLAKIMMGSAAPALLFAWLQISPIAFVVWACILIIIGVREQKIVGKVKKNSIENRD